MHKNEKRKLILLLATAVMTTEAPPSEPPAGDLPPSDTPPADDLTTLFTPEEVTAKKEAMTAAKAEEERRAALTDEQRAEEDKAKAAAEASKVAPETYADFTAPEGITLDTELMQEFIPLAKELNLPQAEAQRVLDLGTKMLQKTIDGLYAQHEQRKTEWLTEAQNDPEIGEDVKLWDPKNPESAKNSVAVRAINTLMGKIPGLEKMMEDTGIGNHPDFIRIFYRLGKNMREDTFENPGSGGTATKSAAERLFPSMNQK